VATIVATIGKLFLVATIVATTELFLMATILATEGK